MPRSMAPRPRQFWEEECEATTFGATTHPNEDISKHVRDAVTPSDINDWMWILNYVRRWTNWTVNVYGGMLYWL